MKNPTPININSLHGGGIIVNYACPSRCGHCLYRSSPYREKDYMTPETARRCLPVIRNLGCHTMHIGGGEPFLHVPRLLEILDTAAASGVAIDYVETNSAWVQNQTTARATLRTLQDHGCDTLLISISPFHNQYIPFAKVRALMDACTAVGMNFFPWTTQYIPEITSFDESKTHDLSEYLQKFGDDFLAKLPTRYHLTFNGRAMDTFRTERPTRSAEAIVAQASTPCHEMLNTTHFHIDLFGGYIPNPCVGLTIACADLGKPLDADCYPVLTLLATKGLAAFYHQATTEHGFVATRDYLNKCDLCEDIRRHLLKQGAGGSELGPAGYYGD